MRTKWKPTGDFLDAVGPHVQQHSAVKYAAAELEEAVQRQGGHVGFTPPFPSVLHVLLELQPPDRTQTSRVVQSEIKTHLI